MSDSIGVLDSHARDLQELEERLFSRFAEGCSELTCMSDHEARLCKSKFSWTDIDLRRFIARCYNVQTQKEVAGTKAARKKLASDLAKAEKEHKEQSAKIEEQIKALQAELAKSDQKVNRLRRTQADVNAAVEMLRKSMPMHRQSEYDSARADLSRGLRAELQDVESDIRTIETVLSPPSQTTPDLSKLTMAQARNWDLWIQSVKRFDKSFVVADSQGRLVLSPAYNARRKELEGHLERFRTKAAELQKQVDAERAKIEAMRDYYLQD